MGDDRLRVRARVREAVSRILAEHASPAELALSVALGVFVACTPFYGLQTVLALGLAWALRLNRVATVLAAQLSIAPVSPFLIFVSVQLGEHLLHGHFFAIDLAMLRERSLPQLGGLFFGAWLLGGCVLGCLLGTLIGAATFVVARARRRTSTDHGVRAALHRAAARYRGMPPRVVLYARIKYFVDPGYLRAAEVVASLAPSLPRRVLDLGCGLGMLSVLLGELGTGAEVTGWDRDEAKLRWARAAARDLPWVGFERADLREVALPPVDCMALLDVLHYNAIDEQDALLRRAAAALPDGGTLLVREADAEHQRSAARFFERVAARLGWHRTLGRFHYRSAASLTAVLVRLGFDVRVRAAGDLIHKGNTLFVATRRIAQGASPAPVVPGPAAPDGA